MESCSYNLEQISEMAFVLSNSQRLGIIVQLLNKSSIVSDLVSELGGAQAVVSKQLSIIKKHGLLKCSSSGRCREYSLANPGLVKMVLDSLNNLSMNSSEGICPEDDKKSRR
ncbi:MAG: winged helix-turn-helix transcriptional regulator [Deltaproteobacteria bacterium]|nr:winged helix-turn-helix transcriptional regulator [Deltaproteobacteria bacterium]